jgi:hypothetical protein
MSQRPERSPNLSSIPKLPQTKLVAKVELRLLGEVKITRPISQKYGSHRITRAQGHPKVNQEIPPRSGCSVNLARVNSVAIISDKLHRWWQQNPKNLDLAVPDQSPSGCRKPVEPTTFRRVLNLHPQIQGLKSQDPEVNKPVVPWIICDVTSKILKPLKLQNVPPHKIGN